MIATILIPLTHRIIALAIAAAVAVTAVEMIRRRKLREDYAMLWMGTSMLLVVLALFPQIPFFLNQVLGINYLTLLTLACFLFLAMIVMHYATAISRDAEHIRQLAQQVALLKEDVARLRDGAPRDAGQNQERPA
jgi:hypothetical protein